MPDLPSKKGHSSIINKLETLSFFRNQTSRATADDYDMASSTVSSRSSSIARKPLPRKDDSLSTLAAAKNKSDNNDDNMSLADSHSSIPLTGRDRQSSQSSSLFSSESRHSKPSEVMLHLTESRLNDLLEDMLDHMGLDETKRVAVRNMPKDAKWMMLNQHMQKLDDSVSNTTAKGSPEFFARQLKDFAHLLQVSSSYHQQQSCCKTVNAIKVSLATQPIIWVKKFIMSDGLSYLLELLDKITNFKAKKDYEFILELELIRCIKALMNNKYGLRDIIQKSPDSIIILARCLISDSFPVKKAAAELLTVICYTDSPTGHKFVWNALQVEISKTQSTVQGETRRLFEQWLAKFAEIVESKDKIGAKGGLIAGVGWVGDNRVTEKEIAEFLISHTIFVNALVGLPEDLDYRVNLRNRLHSFGFAAIFEKLQEFAVGNEFLRRQVEQYQLDLDKDWESLCGELENIKSNESDPFVLVNQIVQMLQNTRGYQYFVSILQNLFCIRRDSSVRSAYFQLIDLVTSQIVFNGKGIDPDFSSTYPIDLGIIIDNFVHHDDVIRLSHENNLLKQMADQLLLERDLQTKLPEAQIPGGYKNDLLASRLKDHQIKLLKIYETLASSAPIIDRGQIRENPADPRDSSVISHSTVLAVENEAAETERTLQVSAEQIEGNNPKEIQPQRSANPETLPKNQIVPPPPPPPPPPMLKSLAVNNLKKTPIYESKRKLKPLQFEKIIDRSLGESFWKSCDDSWVSKKLSGSGVWKKLEDSFADDRSIGKNQVAGKPTPKDNYVRPENEQVKKADVILIDSKKSYNITILMTKLKATPQELGDALLAMNSKVLSPNLVSQLLNYMPNAEEIGILAPYLDDDESLGLAERMLVRMIRVDKCVLRLRSLHFKNLFEERFLDIESGILTLYQASQCTYNSKKLQQFLQLILEFGNVMNGSGFRGGAFGFKMSSLNSLIYLKSNTGETMLDFVLKIVRDEFPDLLSIPEDLDMTKNANRVSSQSIADDYAHVSKYCKELHNEFSKTQMLEGDVLLNFREFVNRSHYRLEKCRKELERCIDQFQKTVIFYGDDPHDISSEDWFGGLKSFLMAFRNSANKLSATSRISIALEPDSLKRDGEKSIKFNQKSDLNTETNEGKGVMDNLLDSLRNGTPMANSDGTAMQQARRPKKVQQLKLEDRTSRRISTDYARQASDLLGKLSGL